MVPCYLCAAARATRGDRGGRLPKMTTRKACDQRNLEKRLRALEPCSDFQVGTWGRGFALVDTA